MAELRVNPTRMELKKLKVRLATACRGHKLLKDKRDELMKRFLELVRQNQELREKVDRGLSGVYSSFSIAAAVSSPKMLETALMLPRHEGKLSVTYENCMNVAIPIFQWESISQSGAACNYGFAFTSGELDSAVQKLSDLLPDLIRLAELEKGAQMLAEEIEKTRRRVNALEFTMIPRYRDAIRSIQMKLEEHERGNITRLMKVKDMTVKREREEYRRMHSEG